MKLLKEINLSSYKSPAISSFLMCHLMIIWEKNIHQSTSRPFNVYGVVSDLHVSSDMGIAALYVSQSLSETDVPSNQPDVPDSVRLTYRQIGLMYLTPSPTYHPASYQNQPGKKKRYYPVESHCKPTSVGHFNCNFKGKKHVTTL